jgi:hypothetical protein
MPRRRSVIPFVGNFAQLLGQKAADLVLKQTIQKPFRWFCMLTDLSKPSRASIRE